MRTLDLPTRGRVTRPPVIVLVVVVLVLLLAVPVAKLQAVAALLQTISALLLVCGFSVERRTREP